MKKIVNTVVPIIQLNKFTADCHKFYGLILNKRKWFIISLAFNENPATFGIYGLMCADTISAGPRLMYKKSLQEVIETHVETGIEVFEFDSLIELMNWVCKKK